MRPDELTRGRIDRDVLAVLGAPFELHDAVNPGKKRVVGTHLHIASGEALGAALANDDRASTVILEPPYTFTPSRWPSRSRVRWLNCLAIL